MEAIRRAPAAPRRITDRLGHNIVWEAPGAVALDIASFRALGRPTDILFHTNYPANIHHIVAEPGQAILIHEP